MQRVSALEMAGRLRISVADLRVLELQDFDLWEIGVLRQYLEAIDCELHVQALGRNFIKAMP